MGNRASSTAPGAPPPLLTAAVTGDATAFAPLWATETNRRLQDRQQNNVLHALFSARAGQPAEILRLIHEDSDPSLLIDLYTAPNQLGCTPLWILIAYGNVELLKIVLQRLKDAHLLQDKLPTLYTQPNHQGDSPLLATCSQGNLDMVQYLATVVPSSNGFGTLLTQANQKGTTPLQIAVANGHVALLEYLLSHEPVRDQVWHTNAAGLSLFHICAERNFAEGLRLLLQQVVNDMNRVAALKDRNGANPLHVACFCGNADIVQVWLEVSDAADLLDQPDGQGRTAYWLAMVQGRDEIGVLLAQAGAQTTAPAQMLMEIREAQERRAARQNSNAKAAIDGNALLGSR